MEKIWKMLLFFKLDTFTCKMAWLYFFLGMIFILFRILFIFLMFYIFRIIMSKRQFIQFFFSYVVFIALLHASEKNSSFLKIKLSEECQKVSGSWYNDGKEKAVTVLCRSERLNGPASDTRGHCVMMDLWRFSFPPQELEREITFQGGSGLYYYYYKHMLFASSFEKGNATLFTAQCLQYEKIQ